MRIKNVIQKTVLSAALFAILPASSSFLALGKGFPNWKSQL